MRLACGWKPGADEFIPDLIVHDDMGEAVRLTATPHLIVEVLSSDRSADTVRKFAKYAAAGVPRYWVIDPAGPVVLAFELTEDGGYREAAEFGPDDEADLDVGPAVSGSDPPTSSAEVVPQLGSPVPRWGSGHGARQIRAFAPWTSG